MAVKFPPPSAPFYTYSAFALVLVGVTLFDFRKHEIPLLVTLPGALAGLVLASLVLPLGFTRSIIGLAFGGGVLVTTTLIEAARKKEVGGGDWKYAAMIGAFVGWPNIITALILTGVFGVGGAIVLKLCGFPSRPQALGPWLSAGAISTLLIR